MSLAEGDGSRGVLALLSIIWVFMMTPTMAVRDTLNATGGTGKARHVVPGTVTLIDLRPATHRPTAWYATVKLRGMPAKCPVLDLIPALAEKGRSARMHLLVGTQRPDAAILSEDLRDLFRFRLALSKVSPQGAMMMWDAAHIGVSLPKVKPGRAIAMGDDSPVEVQMYWTPDPRLDSRPADLALLAALRPDTVAHPARVVVPPETEDGTPSTYAQWAAADLALATDHPQLTLGRPGLHAPTQKTIVDPAEADSSNQTASFDDDYQDSSQKSRYAPAEPVEVELVIPGDLVQVDDAGNHWAVVEGCEQDLLSPEAWCLDWRDDDGDLGSLSLNAGEPITVRRPLEDVDVSNN